LLLLLCRCKPQRLAAGAFGAQSATLLLLLAGTALVPLRLLVALFLVVLATTLLDGVVAAAHSQRLLSQLSTPLDACLAWLRDGHARLSCVLREGVLHLHDAVIQLRAIELLDGVRCRSRLDIDQGGRAQVLPMHVLVEGRRDESAALRKEFLKK